VRVKEVEGVEEVDAAEEVEGAGDPVSPLCVAAGVRVSVGEEEGVAVSRGLREGVLPPPGDALGTDGEDFRETVGEEDFVDPPSPATAALCERLPEGVGERVCVGELEKLLPPPCTCWMEGEVGGVIEKEVVGEMEDV